MPLYTTNEDSEPNGQRGLPLSFTRADFKDVLVSQILDTGRIEKDFGKIHLLIDKLFQNEDDLEQQNSHLFHLKLSLILSAMVQMKNSLVKYLDYEINDENPDKNLSLGLTQ